MCFICVVGFFQKNFPGCLPQSRSIYRQELMKEHVGSFQYATKTPNVPLIHLFASNFDYCLRDVAGTAESPKNS